MINDLNCKLFNKFLQELATFLFSCLNQFYSSPNSNYCNMITFYLVITLAEPHSAGQNQSLHSPHPPFTGTGDLRKISISKSNHRYIPMVADSSPTLALLNLVSRSTLALFSSKLPALSPMNVTSGLLR